MSDGSLFCTDRQDILAKCYVISSRFQPQVFDLIFIQFVSDVVRDLTIMSLEN